MLPIDSLVLDLIFESDASIDPETMLDALGGKDIAATRTLLDPDMQDPMFEMQVSPTMPFRRRGERRLMIVDGGVAPMRKNPRTEFLVPLDLSGEKERLIAVCEKSPVRLGRLFALGSWGDAVLVAKDARDLRAIALLSWVLDPTVDIEGRKRAGRLSQAEIEAKVLGYDQRLDELGEQEILDNLGPATFERRGDLLIVDVLEADGTWDVRKSLELEIALAAVERFSMIIGAPAAKAGPKTAKRSARPAAPAKPVEAPVKQPTPPAGPPLATRDNNGHVVLIFPAGRFDLDVAAALGKKDFDAVLRSVDLLSGQIRDQIYRDGADFVAPLEFLSEVFVDGVPLSRPVFDQSADDAGAGLRSLAVHCPRYGSVLLVDVPNRGRFISSLREPAQRIVELLA